MAGDKTMAILEAEREYESKLFRSKMSRSHFNFGWRTQGTESKEI